MLSALKKSKSLENVKVWNDSIFTSKCISV